jgi:hypothetical protein
LSVVSAVQGPVETKGDDKGHSGRLLLRMPGSLHAELAREAEQHGTSLNQLIVGLLSRAISDGSSSLPAPPAETADAGVAADAIAQRRLGIALAVNLVVLVVAALVAIGLLIGAWGVI